MKDKAHEFALYLPDLNSIEINNLTSLISFKNKELAHRLIAILRFECGQELIIFNKEFNINSRIIELNKNGNIKIEILSKTKNKILSPELTWVLPLLKKDALEESVYSLTEIGVNCIQLVLTEKSQKNFDEKLLARLHSIAISAAEQSKNFNLSQILKPVKLDNLNKILDLEKNKNNSLNIYFDPIGLKISDLIIEQNNKEDNKKLNSIVAMCGPEGDLTIQEKEFIKNLGFKFYSLTPTVLRSRQAVVVGSGILRSFF